MLLIELGGSNREAFRNGQLCSSCSDVRIDVRVDAQMIASSSCGLRERISISTGQFTDTEECFKMQFC